MAARRCEQAMLIRLHDANSTDVDWASDLRGRHVVDVNGDEVGVIEDLFLDAREQKIRFIEVSCPGFFRIRPTRFLIPVDAIARLDDRVHLDRTRTNVAGAPEFSPELIDTRFVVNTYDYYGCEPYWGPTYVLPPHSAFAGYSSDNNFATEKR